MFLIIFSFLQIFDHLLIDLFLGFFMSVIFPSKGVGEGVLPDFENLSNPVLAFLLFSVFHF